MTVAPMQKQHVCHQSRPLLDRLFPALSCVGFWAKNRRCLVCGEAAKVASKTGRASGTAAHRVGVGVSDAWQRFWFAAQLGAATVTHRRVPDHRGSALELGAGHRGDRTSVAGNKSMSAVLRAAGCERMLSEKSR
jgi:hypothetical protein